MSRVVVLVAWDQVPHLTQEAKDDLIKTIPGYLRDARTKGIPQLGSGAVYPFPETDIRVADFPIPEHWPKAFGLDTALAGVTAAAWGAMDPESGVLFIYSVYRRAQAEIAVHAEALKSRGAWIPGVADAAAIADVERRSFLEHYRAHGLRLVLPDKAVEAGVQDVFDRMSAGKLKVFASCQTWWHEFRLYRRDQKGKIVKQADHVLDATRYLVRSGLQRMEVKPSAARKTFEDLVRAQDAGAKTGDWMM